MGTSVRVLVGSSNPVKAAAVEEAFGRYFEAVAVEGVEVESGVADQPLGVDTLLGARNRARALRRLDSEGRWAASYYVGIEGGVMQIERRWFALGCMCVVDRRGDEAFGTSPQFELPTSVIEQLHGGRELGEVIDALTGEQDSKRHGGAIGHFTRGVMDRKALYVAGLVVALVPFLNRDAYFERQRPQDGR